MSSPLPSQADSKPCEGCSLLRELNEDGLCESCEEAVAKSNDTDTYDIEGYREGTLGGSPYA